MSSCMYCLFTYFLFIVFIDASFYSAIHFAAATSPVVGLVTVYLISHIVHDMYLKGRSQVLQQSPAVMTVAAN